MLLFCDSFAHYNTTAAMAKKWQSVAGVATVGPGVTPRPGSAGAVNITGNSTYMLIAGSQRVFTTLAFKINDVGGSLQVQLHNSSGQVGVVLFESTTGTITAQRGGFQGLLATSVANLVMPNVWHHAQIKWTAIASSASGDLQVRLQNQVVLDAVSGQNTDQTAVYNIQRLEFRSSNVTICDLVVHDDQISSPQDFIGDCVVGCSFPIGNGDVSDFFNSNGNHTNNYTYVDDASPDDDTTYVTSEVEGDRDLYQFTPVAADVDLIIGVQALNYAEKVSPGSRSIGTVIKIAGVEYDSPAQTLEDTYVYKRHVMSVSPATGDPWTAAEFNAAQFGPKIVL